MLVDVIAGQVHVIFDNLPSSIGHIKGGKLRAFAVISAEREPSLPGVPAVAETARWAPIVAASGANVE